MSIDVLALELELEPALCARTESRLHFATRGLLRPALPDHQAKQQEPARVARVPTDHGQT